MINFWQKIEGTEIIKEIAEEDQFLITRSPMIEEVQPVEIKLITRFF